MPAETHLNDVDTGRSGLEQTTLCEKQARLELTPRLESTPSSSSVSIGGPKLDSIAQRVRRDASDDAVRFLLRSDVGHNGE